MSALDSFTGRHPGNYLQRSSDLIRVSRSLYDEYQLVLRPGARLDSGLAIPLLRDTRPVVAVACDVPVCPRQLLDTDDAAVDVPADGECLFTACRQGGAVWFFLKFVHASLKCKHDQCMISVDPPRPH